MKAFVVTVNYGLGTGLEHVAADYVKNENGVLIFKREVLNNYPEVISAFAPGRWLEFKQT